jgi:hypothetical protein
MTIRRPRRSTISACFGSGCVYVFLKTVAIFAHPSSGPGHRAPTRPVVHDTERPVAAHIKGFPTKLALLAFFGIERQLARPAMGEILSKCP